MKKIIPILIFPLFCLVNGFLPSCTKDQAADTDKELLDMAQITTGFTWYKNANTLLAKSNASGHSEAFLKTRFNAAAAAKLDAGGKLIDGTSFPDGSLIVKELFKNENTLNRYAILYKKAGHPDADEKGWVWGYLNANGTIATAASQKGAGCKGCHSQGGNIDYILMKKFFP
jgi:hypothetical protein